MIQARRMNKRLTLFNGVGLLFFCAWKEMRIVRRSVSFGNGDGSAGEARTSGCSIGGTAILLYCGVIYYSAVHKADQDGEANVCG